MLEDRDNGINREEYRWKKKMVKLLRFECIEMFVFCFFIIAIALGQETNIQISTQIAGSPDARFIKPLHGFLQLDNKTGTTLTILVLYEYNDFNRKIKWFNVEYWPLRNSTPKCNENSTYNDLNINSKYDSKLVQVRVPEGAIRDFSIEKLWVKSSIKIKLGLFDLYPNHSYGICLESNQINGSSLAWCNCTGEFRTTHEIGEVQHLYFNQENENEVLVVEWEAPTGFENYGMTINYKVCLKSESGSLCMDTYYLKYPFVNSVGNETSFTACVSVIGVGNTHINSSQSSVKCVLSSGSDCAKLLKIQANKSKINDNDVDIEIENSNCSYRVSVVCHKVPTCKAISECDTWNLHYDDASGVYKFAAPNMNTYKILVFYEDEEQEFLVATKEYFHNSDYSDEAVLKDIMNTSVSITWIRPWNIIEPVTISSHINGFPINTFANVTGCSFTVEENNLEPFKNYSGRFHHSSRSGSASEGRNFNNGDNYIITTKPGVCNKVTILGMEEIKFNATKEANPTVLFRLPLNMTGIIERVHLSFRRNKYRFYDRDHDATGCRPGENCSIELEGPYVQPDLNYTIEMYCKNANATLGGISSSIVCKTEAAIPDKGKDILVISKQKWTRSNNSSDVEITISFESLDSIAGTITYAAICYGKIGELPNLDHGYLKEGESPNCTKNVTIELTEHHKSKLTNLAFNEEYAAVLYYRNEVAFTFSNILHFKTRENPTPTIIAVSLIILIFIVLFILSMYFSRIEKSFTSTLNVPDLEFYPSSLEGEEFHHPISKVNWKEELQKLLREPKIEIKKEFFSLSQKNIHGDHPPSVCVAEHRDNMNKNRYFDIVPYDFSRVVLQELPGKDFENYINATYIHSYKVNCGFIACQGPKESTVHDFWRMVVEKNVRVIVMLTRCVEGREKCYKYWPSVTPLITPSNTSIKPLQETVDPSGDYTIRKFLVSQGWDTQEVVQFHFTAWPDKKCPRTANFYSFISEVKSYGLSESSPVIVHCSAGVGRTGSFIALYNLLDEMHDDGKDFIDIYHQVLKMRCFRNYMVQTQSQYIFLYESIFQLFQDNSGEMPRNESEDRMSEDSYEELSEDESGIA